MQPQRLRALFAALICAALFLGLGLAARSGPIGFDRSLEAQYLGGSPTLAVTFTEMGLLKQLAEAGFLLMAMAIAVRWRARALFSLGALIVAHFASDITKEFFKRARPEQWLGVHETSFAYPSGHAASATTLYALWAFWILGDTSIAPRPRTYIAGACALIAGGICWSRIALGAHWPTDIVGGVLLGLTVIFLGLALVGNPAPPLEEEYVPVDLSESSLSEVEEIT